MQPNRFQKQLKEALATLLSLNMALMPVFTVAITTSPITSEAAVGGKVNPNYVLNDVEKLNELTENFVALCQNKGSSKATLEEAIEELQAMKIVIDKAQIKSERGKALICDRVALYLHGASTRLEAALDKMPDVKDFKDCAECQLHVKGVKDSANKALETAQAAEKIEEALKQQEMEAQTAANSSACQKTPKDGQIIPNDCLKDAMCDMASAGGSHLPSFVKTAYDYYTGGKCKTNEKPSIVGTTLYSFVTGVWDNLKAIFWDLPQLAVAGVSYLGKSLWSKVTGAENASSNKAFAASKVTPGFLADFKKDPKSAVISMLKDFINGIGESVRHTVACQKWEPGAKGPGNTAVCSEFPMSPACGYKCTQPLASYDCLGCSERLAIMMGTVGYGAGTLFPVTTPGAYAAGFMKGSGQTLTKALSTTKAGQTFSKMRSLVTAKLAKAVPKSPVSQATLKSLAELQKQSTKLSEKLTAAKAYTKQLSQTLGKHIDKAKNAALDVAIKAPPAAKTAYNITLKPVVLTAGKTAQVGGKVAGKVRDFSKGMVDNYVKDMKTAFSEGKNFERFGKTAANEAALVKAERTLEKAEKDLEKAVTKNDTKAVAANTKQIEAAQKKIDEVKALQEASPSYLGQQADFIKVKNEALKDTDSASIDSSSTLTRGEELAASPSAESSLLTSETRITNDLERAIGDQNTKIDVDLTPTEHQAATDAIKKSKEFDEAIDPATKEASYNSKSNKDGTSGEKPREGDGPDCNTNVKI